MLANSVRCGMGRMEFSIKQCRRRRREEVQVAGDNFGWELECGQRFGGGNGGNGAVPIRAYGKENRICRPRDGDGRGESGRRKSWMWWGREGCLSRVEGGERSGSWMEKEEQGEPRGEGGRNLKWTWWNGEIGIHDLNSRSECASGKVRGRWLRLASGR